MHQGASLQFARFCNTLKPGERYYADEDGFENEDGKYDITIVTALFKEGEESQGCRSKMRTFNTAEIEDIMNIEDNVRMKLDDFIESVEMIRQSTQTIMI